MIFNPEAGTLVPMSHPNAMNAEEPPELLLMEPDPVASISAWTLLSKASGVHVHVARSIAAAEKVVASARLCGVLSEIDLSDGCGLRFCAAMRKGALRTALVRIYTNSTLTSEHTALTDEHGFGLIKKPYHRARLISFAHQAIAGDQQLGTETRVSAAVELCVASWRLTAREGELLRLWMNRIPRSELGQRLRLRADRVDDLVRAIIAKSGVDGARPDMKDVRAEVLRVALTQGVHRGAR